MSKNILALILSTLGIIGGLTGRMSNEVSILAVFTGLILVYLPER